MEKFTKSLKQYKMVEPVYCNLFELRFKSNVLKYQDAVMLTEQVSRMDYVQNPDAVLFGTKGLNIVFSQNVIDKRIQPLSILEMLKTALDDETSGTTLDINLHIHDKEGEVLRKVRFFGCKLVMIDSGSVFDYANQDIFELHAAFTYDKMSTENN